MKIIFSLKGLFLSVILGVMPLHLFAMKQEGGSTGEPPAAKRARSGDGQHRDIAASSVPAHDADEVDHVSPTPPPGDEDDDDIFEEESDHGLIDFRWRDEQHRLWIVHVRADAIDTDFSVKILLSGTGIGRLRLDNVVIPKAVLHSFCAAIPVLIEACAHGTGDGLGEVIQHFITHPRPEVLVAMMVNFLRTAPGVNFPALMEMLQIALAQVGISMHFQHAGGAHHSAPAEPSEENNT